MSKSVLCIGATLVDELYFCDGNIVPHTSNPAQKITSIGGVMSNIVQHLALLEIEVALLTALGNDADGVYITTGLEKLGIDLSQSVGVEDTTGKYVSILNSDGSLYVAVCQDISDKYITVEYLATKADYLRSFEVLLIDTNLAPETIQWLIHFAKTHQQTLIIEPVSVPKSAKLTSLNLEGVFMITPNEEEIQVLNKLNNSDTSTHIAHLHQRGVSNVWLRKGHQGSVMHQEGFQLPLSVPTIPIVDTTGAGDSALAGWLFGYLQQWDDLSCLQLGHTLAFEILQIKGTVDPTMTKEKLQTLKHTYYHD